MTHVSEEQLVLFHYGDADDHMAIRVHLDTCEACAAEYERLRQMLNTVGELPDPEPGEGYSDRVWQKIRPVIVADSKNRTRTISILPWRRMAWVAAAAATIALAFLTGRFSQDTLPPEVATTEYVDRADKAILLAMNEHLERTSMMLVALVNADGNGTINIASEQLRARELVSDNRLFRQIADDNDDRAMVVLLDQVERLLMEVANGPGEVPAEDYELVRRDIEDGGLLFRVRLTQSHGAGAERVGEGSPFPGVI